MASSAAAGKLKAKLVNGEGAVNMEFLRRVLLRALQKLYARCCVHDAEEDLNADYLADEREAQDRDREAHVTTTTDVLPKAR